jgi:hypothetical protein
MSVYINKRTSVVTINLNKSFYNVNSIKQTVKDFSGVCSASIKGNDRFEITLKAKVNLDIYILGYEFCNYLLALMKNENIV